MKENTRVKDQYIRWPYPEPVYDLNKYFKKHSLFGCLSTDRGFFAAFPRRKRFEPNILIAGCGSFQAAAVAFKNKGCQVVGVDISSTSLRLTDDLKRKHGLENLTLHEMSLLDIADLRLSFDFIISTGVIHHLPKPNEALKALKSVMSADGVMHLMVYGTTLRTGVYQLQQVFRHLQIDPKTEDELWGALQFIKQLPKTHPVHRYIAAAGDDLAFPGGIFDTFFHSQDTSYTLSEVYDLVNGENLVFTGLANNADYYFHEKLIGNLIQEHYKDQFSELDFFQQAAIVDLLGGHRGTHRFYVSAREIFNLSTSTLPENFDDVVPALAGLRSKETNNGAGVTFGLEGYPEFYPAKSMIAVTNLINMKRTFGDITNELIKRSEGLSHEKVRTLVFRVSRELWMRGALLFVG